jgi:hypothetical protein
MAAHPMDTASKFITDPTAALKMGFEQLSNTVMEVTGGFTNLIQRGLDPAIAVIGEFTNVVTRQVAAYNPGLIERFNFALDNLTAAAGKMFQPIIEAATDFADDLNRLYTSIAAPISDLVESIAEPIKEFAREFAVGFVAVLREGATVIKPFIDNLAPLGRMLGMVIADVMKLGTSIGQAIYGFVDGIVDLSGGLKEAVEGLRTFVVAMYGVANTLDYMFSRRFVRDQALLGVVGTAEGMERAYAEGVQAAAQRLSQGSQIADQRTFAAQPARFVGIEEIGQQARQAAFSLTRDVPQEQLDVMQRILQIVQDMKQAGFVFNADEKIRELQAMMMTNQEWSRR